MPILLPRCLCHQDARSRKILPSTSHTLTIYSSRFPIPDSRF
ncbi:hypothetical protein BJP36_40395 [Moorena producens JHB]|uniref:Uncharacterized protein n=1 Tax=Moorena producens (strain JHB) TaxID=1454205 RepID=A0A9Q9SS64_MOOP1|nr:hypothetical protein [Moorena producens]WAN68636.1 hypothetical protein BJP36_40395 [Moorena producens JHB]